MFVAEFGELPERAATGQFGGMMITAVVTCHMEVKELSHHHHLAQSRTSSPISTSPDTSSYR